MRRTHQYTALRLLCLLVLIPQWLPANPKATIPSLEEKSILFTVRDTNGNPVEGAVVEASRHGAGNATGRTDKQGRLRMDLTKGASLHVHVSRKGYYTSSGELWHGGMVKGPDGNLVAKEVPDAFDLVLKAIRQPVDLIKVHYRGNAPKSDKPMGFDLEKADWVEPYGTGTTTDLYFHFHDIDIKPGSYKGTLTVSFPHPRDGLQEFRAPRPVSRAFGSSLAPPHKAPVSGYRPSQSFALQYRKGEPFTSYVKKDRNFIIRTRSVTDAGGTLRQACYGWIQGDFRFDPRDPMGPQLEFICFFNPDPDPLARSLEERRWMPARAKLVN